MKKNFLAPLLSLALLASFGVALISSTSVYAEGEKVNPPKPFTIDNPLNAGDTITDLLKTLVNDILLPIASILAVLSFIYSGFIYVMARGNENEIKRAHRALLYSAVGTAILLGAWTIVNVLTGTIGKLKV